MVDSFSVQHKRVENMVNWERKQISPIEQNIRIGQWQEIPCRVKSDIFMAIM